MSSLFSRHLGPVERLVVAHDCGAELDVLIGRGGCLVGWRVVRNGKTVELLDGYSSAEDLHERYHSSHCGARLSPFPNRIKDGKWHWKGVNHSLLKNFPWEQGHAIHGMLFDLPWTKTDFTVTGDTAWLTLECAYDGKQPGFPFPYTAVTRYGLSSQGIEVQTLVRNTGHEALPFGEGWHPYFRVGGPIDQAELHMALPTLLVEVDDRSIPTRTMIPDDDFSKPVLIGARNLNTCWKFAGPAMRADVTLRNPTSGLTLRYWQTRGEGGYDYIQLYTPPARESLAIEPMTCPPDVLNNQLGLILLVPGAEHLLSWGATVE
jgi:aldose 1-epimerase